MVTIIVIIVIVTPSDRAMRLVSRVRIESERTGSSERRSGPFRHIAAKFRFHLNGSDKFALFGSKIIKCLQLQGASPH